jgi:hypothetical protein
LYRFPVIIHIIVENGIAASTAFEDDGMARVPYDVIFDLVLTVPVVKFNSVVSPGVIGDSVMMVVVPVFILI